MYKGLSIFTLVSTFTYYSHAVDSVDKITKLQAQAIQQIEALLTAPTMVHYAQSPYRSRFTTSSLMAVVDGRCIKQIKSMQERKVK